MIRQYAQIYSFTFTSRIGKHCNNRSYRNLQNLSNKMNKVIKITTATLTAMVKKGIPTTVISENVVTKQPRQSMLSTYFSCLYLKLFYIVQGNKLQFADKLQWKSTTRNFTKARPVDTRCFMWTKGRTRRHYNKNTRFSQTVLQPQTLRMPYTFHSQAP